MVLTDARKLKTGDEVQHRNGFEYTVKETREHSSWTNGKITVFIVCETETGSLMKFGHKELFLKTE